MALQPGQSLGGYQVTGSLNMADLSQILPALHESRVVLVAFGFLVIGIAMKMALFPLHWWQPNAYAYAPSAVSAFVAATATHDAIATDAKV